MIRRVLVTDADHFLGPASVQRFRDGGDDVAAVRDPIGSRSDVTALLADGPFDVVVANLAVPITVATIEAHTDADWRTAFARLVDPLFWLLAECLPPMVDAGAGAFVVPTSATALRTSRHPIIAYEAARSAQTSMVRSAGREVAPHGVRVNGIAPNYVANPTYYPAETVADERFQAAVRRDVPAGRLGEAAEAAAMLHWLASDDASFVHGAVLPADGGWSLG